jgi:hypothetical protein
MNGDLMEIGTAISFRPLADATGVEIVDPIDRHRYRLETPSPVDPRPAAAEQFRYPVDAAVEFTTDAIALPTVVSVYVHDETGDVVANADHMADEQLPAGSYSIEIPAPIKLYLRVDGPVHVSSDMLNTILEFGEGATVTVGARSRHERPAATLTVTEDPVDMMRAVSAFGSALKTTSVERSYPTLRGHPPTVELGDELDVPDGLAPPDNGVTLELPPEHRAVYVTAPLAYYLGATVVPGDRPRLLTDSGLEVALDGPREFEAEVERVLKQVFFLDCLTRTEGSFGEHLYERSEVEAEVDLDFADLYDRSLAEQLEAYLDVPYSLLEPHLPEWKVTTHIVPTATSIETLPFLVNDLAVVRTPRTETTAESSGQATAVEEFFRNDEFTRSASASQPSAGVPRRVVQPEEADSLEQVWVGDETPKGASKATATAYRHRLDRDPKEGNIEITVVCNDEEMAEEGDFVDDAYGDREELPFDINVRRNLTTGGLAELLEEDQDFLHYIGHIEPEGFLCSDGLLDADDLNDVGVEAFLLNACSSYDQGMALIESGSIGGVVTLSDVINSGAVRIGCALSSLLNRGFPLRAALNIAREESLVGGQYIVIGDGGLAIAQAESGIPMLLEIDRVTGDKFEVEIETYPTSQRGLGAVFTPFIGEEGQQYLSSGRLETFRMKATELKQFLSLELLPVKVGSRLYWSDDLNLAEI